MFLYSEFIYLMNTYHGMDDHPTGVRKVGRLFVMGDYWQNVLKLKGDNLLTLL